MSGLVETTAPAVEPMDLEEAKLHLRVTSADEDSKITALLTTARRMAERYTNRAFVETVFTLYLDAFPADNGTPIEFPRADLISVDQVQYIDTAGVTQAWAAANYKVIATQSPGLLFPAFGKSWPSTRDEANAVTIQFKAGYGQAAADVPRDIRDAILLFIGTLYMSREDIVIGVAAHEVPLTGRSLLDPYRVFRL